MKKLIAIPALCILVTFSCAADDDGLQVKINGAEYKIEVDKNQNNPWSISTLTHTRFVTCENCAGAGFFWVDTRRGEVWWVDPAKTEWVYYGAIGRSGQNGRYMPFRNDNGEGLFILDTLRGEGWWTNGSQWKKMGMPGREQKKENP